MSKPRRIRRARRPPARIIAVRVLLTVSWITLTAAVVTDVASELDLPDPVYILAGAMLATLTVLHGIRQQKAPVEAAYAAGVILGRDAHVASQVRDALPVAAGAERAPVVALHPGQRTGPRHRPAPRPRRS
jgi:hypothetical protein